MSAEETGKETIDEQAQTVEGAEEREAAETGGFPCDMKKMKEMMVGKGCGGMMAACCGGPSQSEGTSTEEKDSEVAGASGGR